MLKAKIKEKLLNRRNEVDVDEIKDSNGNVIDLEKLINNPEIKGGIYLISDNYKWVEDYPEDYTGQTLELFDDGIYVYNLDDGAVTDYVFINSGTVQIFSDINGTVYLDSRGITKINARSGTPVTVYGEDSDGKLVKGAYIGETQLYKHSITNIEDENEIATPFTMIIISADSTPVTSSGILQALVNKSCKAFGSIFTNQKLYVWNFLSSAVCVEAIQDAQAGNRCNCWDDGALKFNSNSVDTVTPL